MPKQPSIEKLFPRLNGVIDPKADIEIFLAFQRVYDYINDLLRKIEEAKVISSDQTKQLATQTSELISNFASKLIQGNNSSSSNNPLATLGSGTVTSVAATGNILFSISGSPIVESGTFSFTLLTQAANTVLAGPVSGGAATPTFRSLDRLDINFPYKLTTSSNADPTTGDYANGTWGVHKNLISGDVFITYNDGGVIKKLTLI